MNKRILIGLCMLFIACAGYSQTTIEAKRVKAVDSLYINGKWVKYVITDSTLSGATSRDLVSAEAVKDFVLNRLAFAIKSGDTASMLSGYAQVQRVLDSLNAVQTRIQTKLTKSDADTYYPAIQRMLDSLTSVQVRIQSKLTQSDADTYYPAIQRMIDSLSAVQTRIQGKLTKSDADTYYPAIQRMIDSLSAVQTRIQGKLTKSDADTYYPAIQRVLDSLTDMQSRIQTKQPLLGYTAENSANKATDFTTVNNVLYPTVQAVSNYIQSALTGVLKDRGNYDASGNTFPASGGSGSGGAIKTGDMWYINVGGTLGGKAVTAGAWVRSLTDAPGQTAGNWAIADGGFGFVPENVANKSTNTSLGTSNTAYPSQNAVKTYVDNATANASNWNTAYNKRPSSASISSSTFTLTLGDGTTVTASIPTFNQNTSGNAATATNATQWNGREYDHSEAGTISALMSYDASIGKYFYSTNASIKTWLGLGSYAYRSAGLAELSGADFTGTLSNSGMSAWTSGTRYFVSIDAGTARFRYNTESQLQSWLGLGSNAYTSTAYVPYTGATSNVNLGSYTISAGLGKFGSAGSNASLEVAVSSGEIFRADGSGGALRIVADQSGVTLGGSVTTISTFSSGTTITAGTYYTLSGRTNSYAYRLPDWQIYNSTGGGIVLSDYSNDIFTLTSTNATLLTELNTNGQGRFKGWYTSGTGLALEVGVASGAGNVIAYNRTTSSYANLNIGGVDVNVALNGGTFNVNGGAANYSSTVAGTSFLAGGRTIIGGSYIADQSGTGNNTGISFGATSIFSTNGAGTSTVKDLGSISNRWGAINGSIFSENTVTVSSNYTVASDVGTVFCDSHTYTVTLPSASSFPGREITIKRISSGVGTGITISGVTLGSSELGGSLGCHGAAVYKSNGTNWYCITYRTGGCD